MRYRHNISMAMIIFAQGMRHTPGFAGVLATPLPAEISTWSCQPGIERGQVFGITNNVPPIAAREPKAQLCTTVNAS